VNTAFGEWVTDAKTGVAHYVLGGKCLCGTRLAKPDGPPKRKPLPGPGGYGAFITPHCEDCMDLNAQRWQSGKATARG
jgi:hypothetical protein